MSRAVGGLQGEHREGEDPGQRHGDDHGRGQEQPKASGVKR